MVAKPSKMRFLGVFAQKNGGGRPKNEIFGVFPKKTVVEDPKMSFFKFWDSKEFKIFGVPWKNLGWDWNFGLHRSMAKVNGQR